MPIQEAYREEALLKLKNLCQALNEKVEELLKEVDEEDLEFGIKLDMRAMDLEELWRSAIEENNYMEITFTEIMEHHDGAYLKAVFRNQVGYCHGERYVSVRSSGRVEIGHALIMEREAIKIRVEKASEGVFKLFIKAK
ncbi:MAG: hypothetical protein ACK4LA_03765 [Aquificaceae bacterium]